MHKEKIENLLRSYTVVNKELLAIDIEMLINEAKVEALTEILEKNNGL